MYCNKSRDDLTGHAERMGTTVLCSQLLVLVSKNFMLKHHQVDVWKVFSRVSSLELKT